MSYSQPLKTYPIASMAEDVPPSIGSDTRARPLPSSVRTISIASTSGAQKPGGYSTFYLPSGNSSGIIKPYSMYLQFDITFTGTAADTLKFNGPCNSASACVDRLTLSMNNQVVEQINAYNIYHDTLLLMTTNKNYLETDAALLEGAGITYTVGGGGTITANVCVPVLASTFNNQKGFPLYLLNQALQLQFDWNSLNKAVVKATGTAITDYTINNTYIVYDSINVDESYKASVRQAMMDPSNPKMYMLNITNVFGSNISYAAATGTTLNLGVNYSSLRGVIWSNQVDPASTTQTAFKQENQNNAKLVLDGVAVNNFALSNTAIQFAEANKVFNNLWDSNATFALAAAQYTTNGYVGGISCTKFNDGANAFVGTPCQNLELTLTASSATTAANKLYYFLLSDMAIAIDASGNITMIR